LARKLTDYRLGLYGSRGYLAETGEIRRRADLAGHRFIGYIEELLYAPELDYLQAPDVEIRASLKSSNLIAQLRATLAGGGLCVLPEFIAAAEPELVQVLPEKVGLVRSFWLLTHADLRDVARVRTAAAFITDEVRRARAVFLPGQPEETA
jgi:DNA-binding transcriptional LysR family regulator